MAFFSKQHNQSLHLPSTAAYFSFPALGFVLEWYLRAVALVASFSLDKPLQFRVFVFRAFDKAAWAFQTIGFVHGGFANWRLRLRSAASGVQLLQRSTNKRLKAVGQLLRSCPLAERYKSQ